MCMCVLHCSRQSWPIFSPVLRHCPNFCARRWPFVRTFELTDCPTSSLQHEIFLGNVQKTLFVLATTILLEKSNIKFKAFLIFILSQNPNYQTTWRCVQVMDGDDDSQVVGQGMQEGPEHESGDGRTVCAHPGPQCARGRDRRPTGSSWDS